MDLLTINLLNGICFGMILFFLPVGCSGNALRALAIRVRRDSRLVEELSFGQVINQVARLLLKYMEWETRPGIRLTQQDMTNMTGSSREMVNKSLRYIYRRLLMEDSSKR